MSQSGKNLITLTGAEVAHGGGGHQKPTRATTDEAVGWRAEHVGLGRIGAGVWDT